MNKVQCFFNDADPFATCDFCELCIPDTPKRSIIKTIPLQDSACIQRRFSMTLCSAFLLSQMKLLCAVSHIWYMYLLLNSETSYGVFG